MSKAKQYSVDDFTLIKVIGRGCFGKIILVKENKTEKIFAMKVLKKKIL